VGRAVVRGSLTVAGVSSLPFVNVSDVRIYYEVVGQGEPVVLLNGIFMSTASWVFQRNHLARYGYTVVLHDMRGQWESDKPRDEKAYSLEIHAEDLRNLLDFLGFRKVHLVGTSYGGEVAMVFALKYREYVNDLSIITSVSEVHEALRLTALRWLEGAMSRDPRKFVLSWINDVYSENFISRQDRTFFTRLVEYFSSQKFDFDAATFLLKSFLRLSENPITQLLKDIDVPTLVVAAEEDRVKPPKYSKIIARSIPNSTYVEVREAGHAVVLEKPGTVNYLLTGFIRSNPMSNH